MKSRTPEVAKGLELPDEDGAFVLDTYQGTTGAGGAGAVGPGIEPEEPEGAGDPESAGRGEGDAGASGAHMPRSTCT